MEYKCKIFKKVRKEKGITLVALVVTIVILMILAGVSINLILQNNGIVAKAEESREKYGQAKVNEQNGMKEANDWIESHGKTIEVVEPENPSDWACETKDNGELVITQYKGTETEIVIPNYINGVAVKRIEGKNILPHNGETVHIGGSASWFSGNKTVTKITISDGIEEVGDYSFAGCRAVKDVYLSSTLKTIGSSAFYENTSLTNIDIPDELERIGSYAFFWCTGLSSIKIPDSAVIGAGTFCGCTGLTSITIPDSVTSIGNDTFRGCIGLTSITIPNAVTSIGHAVFESCTNLTSITISDSVTSIGNFVFDGCSALVTVNYTGTKEQWKNITIGSDNTPLTNATIVYNYKSGKK